MHKTIILEIQVNDKWYYVDRFYTREEAQGRMKATLKKTPNAVFRIVNKKDK